MLWVFSTSDPQDYNPTDKGIGMQKNDPKKPEFASWKSYGKFVHDVRRTNRYVWNDEIKAFLDTVLATLRDRDVKIEKGHILYRAQRGVSYRPTTDEDGNEVGEEPIGLSSKRMKPPRNHAFDGRVSPIGIPALYLASHEKTAMLEVRPWVGSKVSVAQFKVKQDLKAVNLTKGHGQISFMHLTAEQLFGDEAITPEDKEKAVWIDIDCAFSRPVMPSDNALDYIPTQILSELFRSVGYEAVIYRSQFGKNGHNIALFNTEYADAINCAPYQVGSINLEYSQMGNHWWSNEHYGRSEGEDR